MTRRSRTSSLSSPRPIARRSLRGRIVRLLVPGVTSLALVGVAFVGPSPVAAADPPLTVAEAKSQVDTLETEAAALDQEYVAVREKLKDGRKKLLVKQADVRRQTAKVARMRQQVGQVALAQFQNRNLDTAARLLLTEDTDGFLNQISTVEKVSENQNATLQDFQAEQGKLTALERSAATDVAALNLQDKELKRLRSSSDDKVTQAKAVLAKLTQEERDRIAAAERDAQQSAQQTAEGTDPATTTPTTPVSGSSKGAQVLAFAKSQLGKPYRFGAEGPSAYDCSGLTMAAFRRVGVSLPRISWDQYGVGRTVSISELQPGDLVFFYSNRSHVGIYAGNGMIIHAPRPGKRVEYIKMSYMPVNGASRPG